MTNALPILGGIRRALTQLERASYFAGWDAPPEALTNGNVTAVFRWKVILPTSARDNGESTTGVRVVESVSIQFSPYYPSVAPVFRLRLDFPRTFAHLNPCASDQAPEPCLLYGSRENLLLTRGFPEFLNRLSDWLRKAAADALNEESAGWEPVRRDHVYGHLVLDPVSIRRWATQKAVFEHRECTYNNDNSSFQITLHDKIQFAKVDSQSLWQSTYSSSAGWYGKAVCICMHAQLSSGALPIFDRYLPDDVSDVRTLSARAAQYGCNEILDSFIAALPKHVQRWTKGEATNRKPIPVVLLFCVRRPRPIVGTESDIELLAYVLTVTAADATNISPGSAIRPISIRYSISRESLNRTSDGSVAPIDVQWVLIGCGSLGSKVALTLTREALAPSTVIDSSNLSPHHFARHGLIPTLPEKFGQRPGGKASALATEIRRFDAAAYPVAADVRYVADNGEPLLSPNTLVVDATASVAVREALTRTQSIWPRQLRIELFDQARVGLFSLAGSTGNPDLGEIAAQFAFRAMNEAGLNASIYQTLEPLSMLLIGEGCNSETMIVSDAMISMQSSGLSRQLSRFLRAGLPETGWMSIGTVQPDDLSVIWTQQVVDEWVRVPLRTLQGRDSEWMVHLSAEVNRKIIADVKHHPGVETGGVLIGFVAEASQRIYVLDVLSAPIDSMRSPNVFTLGKEGLPTLLAEISQQSNGYFRSVGTWHNHLSASEPSRQDHDVAATLSRTAGSNAVLVLCPDRYRGLLADTLMDN